MNMKHPAFSNVTGFTLMELLITVAIIAILVTVAIPSYNQYLIRANRADAQDKLTEIMYQQERFNLRNRAYTVALRNLGYVEQEDGSVLSNEGFYAVSANACAGTTIANCVLLTANPVEGNVQAGDDPLSLNSRGARVGPWRR